MKRILLGTLLFVSIISINQIAFAIDGNVRVNVFNRAIKNGNIEKVQEYINKGFDPNETYLGGAVICTAIQKRQNEMLDFLLANGANANNPKSQVQPLYYAVAKKNPYAVEKLLLAGADQSKTFMGHTAEEFARIQNYTDIITVFEKFNNSNIAQNRIKKKNDKFCGIGVQLYKDKNKIFAIKVLKNSPAEKVYFPVGAEIIEIDNIKVKKMSIDDVQEMIRGENKTYVNVLAKSSSGKRIYKIQREPINLRKVAKNKNFENHWLQVVPQAYRQAEFFSIVPQYSNNLKSELYLINYWANRKLIFQKGYDTCMTYPKSEQNACLINLVNRENQRTHNDEQLEMQELMYRQQAIQNYINGMNQIQTNMNLQNINNSIQQNNFQLQQQNMQLWQINNSINRF